MDQIRYQIVSFVADEDLLIQFKDALSRDQLSMAKAVEQFLSSYVYCLDSSFTDGAGKKRTQKGRKLYQSRIPANIYNAFVEKTDKEKTDVNLLLEQFFRNYTAFIKKHKR